MKKHSKGKIVTFLSFLITALIVFWVTTSVQSNRMPAVDSWSAPIVEELNHNGVFMFFRWITELGSGTFVSPFISVFAIVFFLFTRNWLAGLIIPLGSFLGYRLNYWIKLFVERERPSLFPEAEGVGFSFPSGHAMGAMITYGLVVYFLTIYMKEGNRRLTVQLFFVILILLIGMSRYMIQVHYLTDVVAGYGYGFLFLVLWILLYHFINKLITRKKRMSPPKV
ncbi:MULTISPECIES: phosphatase PAP2 family protein [Paraliobacillus]|uniref:phosphatase PAP2 family protein n=1 Tax=Paraliobacillus TaxID=200903 RepID=UPI0013005889|nr:MULTISPECIES: phosphatase PAP2 family protein [Paraliobacillus]